MKKVVLSVIIAAIIMPQALAFNALKEHALYRGELNSFAGKQHAENQRYILYYKGTANYTTSQMRSFSYSKGTTAQKDIYVKKGVKFKVDEAKQEQRLKEVKETEIKEVKKETNTQVEPQKSELPVKPTAKSISSKVKLPKKLKSVTQKSIPKQQTELPKMNVNLPVKNSVKPAVQSQTQTQTSQQEQTKFQSNGKNADAE